MVAEIDLAPTVNGDAKSKINGKIKSKNQLRRLKQKQKKVQQEQNGTQAKQGVNDNDMEMEEKMEIDDDVDLSNVEYVSEPLDIKGTAFEAFSDVFARFQPPPEETVVKDKEPTKGEVIYSDDDMESEGDSEAEQKPLSKKKARKLKRLTVAELKQLVKKPELVEWTDVTAADPRILLHIKSHRNTVPIPAHWSAKRDYLQGKRGIEKPPFQLPAYIADTGIAQMRDAIKEKEANMSLKAKTRERVQPKMGKMDIDYQKLHDAFFKYQTKPPVAGFGEMYYEGKEFETQLKEKRPGDLSPELVEALSIPPLAPPPWLISMQRFGPPPSYPTLRIPGLNAPIPEGAQWGFHPGGWGKPPLDEYNRPLYGDVFGVLPKVTDTNIGEPVDKELWGELEPEEEEEEEESEEEEEEEEAAEPTPMDGMQTPSGMETPSGMASVVSTVAGGLETPDFLELRKSSQRSVSEAVDSGPRSLYQVIPEKQTSIRGLMGSDRAYDVSTVANSGAPIPVLGDERTTKRKSGVDVTLDASELEGISEEELRRKYDASSRGNAGVPGSKEDFSDMVAKEMAKKKQKMDREREGKKGKEFNHCPWALPTSAHLNLLLLPSPRRQMSLVQLTLRPPPHVDFVTGYPGIPPNGSDRPQAAVRGALEVRVPLQGVKTQYVRIELQKMEVLPGGGPSNTFYDPVGPGAVTLWAAENNNEYEVLRAQDFPFSIRIPESIPPSLELDMDGPPMSGVFYELIATVCTKGKRRLFRKRKVNITRARATVIIDKHELHSTWPVYCQPEKRHVIRDGIKLTVERNQSCYGPGDRISVTASVWSDNVHTVILRSFEILLKETISFRGHMFVAGRKGEPMTRTANITDNGYQVNTPLHRGMQTTQDLYCILPMMHATTTLTAARHIDINYVLLVKALVGAGQPLIVELPVIISNWQKSVSLEAIRRIGDAPGLSLRPTPRSGAPDTQVITRVEPIKSRTLSSDPLNRPTTAETNGHYRKESYNATVARVDDPYTSSSKRPTHQASGSQGSTKSGMDADEFGNWPRSTGNKLGTGAGKRPPSAGSLPSQTPRFTITNALPLEIPEDSQSPQYQRNAIGSNKGQWLSATEEKQRLYEQAKARVEMAQGGVAQSSMSSIPPPVTQVTSPHTKPQSRSGPWPTAEEEKLKLFHSAQAAVARNQGYGTIPSATDPTQFSSTNKPPSAAAAMYSQAMSAVRNDPAKRSHPPLGAAKVTLPPSLVQPSKMTKAPGYLTAEEEKAALRRYEEAKRAVDRTQYSGILQDTPGGSGSGLVPYDSLYPSAPSDPTAQAMGPPPLHDLPPPFEAGPPLSAPQQLSEKERLRRNYEAQDAATPSRQSSTTITTPQRGSPVAPLAPYDGLPPPFGGNSAYASATAEKELLRRRFEGQDVAANGLPNAKPPQTPPRSSGSTHTNSSLPRNGSISSTLRSRPAPLPPPAVDGNGQRVLTAAEEKALLRAKYEAHDAAAGGEAPPPMYVNGYTNGLPSAGSSSDASQSNLSYVSSMQILSPPPLMPRPPQEYIKETQEEDARVTRMVMNRVMSPRGIQDEEKTEMGHSVPRKLTATPAPAIAAPFDKPPLPPKPLGE
ncbi:hypothetical protein AX15_000844 [Amanita polypyramis BW_CC]|nr:hypothetical protein AX15_000844 [Amanita polypyramis BW_CC]